ncbi:PmbA/TldA family metallopeptidase [Neosynechococcus sphagnicola]|uniref:PmbA/TldA family metallopeptidase n=1 Tax=Neosynechococcus sphagnicola TaxID=1501145 RepID=UPI000A4B1014
MPHSRSLLSQELPTLHYTATGNGQGSLSEHRFDETWEAPLSSLLGLGRAAGADFVEFFLERVNFVSCLAEEDAITSISPRLSTGAGVRVFRGQADCYVSTNDLSFTGLKAALEKGLAIMGLHLPAPTAFVPEVNLELLRDYATPKGKNFLVSWL